MAAYGTSAADFGRTRKSATYSRTVVAAAEPPKETEETSGVTPAAADFLASLRDELVAKKAESLGAASDSAGMSKVQQGQGNRAGSALKRQLEEAGAEAGPADSQGAKRFLSKAERRKEKKARCRAIAPPTPSQATPSVESGSLCPQFETGASGLTVQQRHDGAKLPRSGSTASQQAAQLEYSPGLALGLPKHKRKKRN